MSIEQLIDDTEKDIWQVMRDPEDISVRKTAEQIVERVWIFTREYDAREQAEFAKLLMKDK